MRLDFAFILEVIAVAAFAIFGANAAIENKMDVFGVIVLAAITAVGGGLIRDIILNVEVPVMFANPMYCIVTSITAILVILTTNFMRMRRVKQKLDVKKSMEIKAKFDYIVTLCDAVGMGYFAIAGVDMAIACGHRSNVFLVIFIGTITATGGGVIRDMMLCRQPFIFKKEIYATAAVIGSLLYYFIVPYINQTVAMYLCTCIIAVIRMYTMKKNINLPSLFLGSRMGSRNKL